MATSNQLFFLFLLLTMIFSAITSEGAGSSDFITAECGKTFPNNEILDDNVNSVILDLLTQTSVQLFANSSHGHGGDTVYGVADCRRDVTRQSCSACIASAARRIRTACPYAAEAGIWYQYCSLRYSTTTFSGQLDTDVVGTWFSAENMTNPAAFRRTLNELTVVLLVEATGKEGRRFAWGEIRNRNLMRNNGEEVVIYGMAQCRWDLGENACTRCLLMAIRVRDSDCGVAAGCYVISRSCAVRYEISPFLFFNPSEATRSIAFGSI